MTESEAPVMGEIWGIFENYGIFWPDFYIQLTVLAARNTKPCEKKVFTFLPDLKT